jgi:hypothetical protein
METIEYRVRPVTRYVVTKYESDGIPQGCTSIRTLGEYDNQMVAQEVGYALCKAEHERLGWAPGDTRIKYPEMVPVCRSEMVEIGRNEN